MAGFSQGSPGWQAYLQGQAQQQAAGPAGDPTASAGFVVNQSQPLSQAQISQWQNYFQSGAGAPAAPQMTPEQVQTGTQWAATNPGLLGNVGLLNNLSSLGIAQGATPQATAANINASPLTGNFSGTNPANPYYSQILAQMGQGTQTPTYSTQMVPTGGAPSSGQWAQMVGGQLIGNATPQEQQLAQYFGLQPGQTQYLPDMLNSYAAAPAGSLTSATAPLFNANVLAQAGGLGLTPQEQQNYLASISGVGHG